MTWVGKVIKVTVDTTRLGSGGLPPQLTDSVVIDHHVRKDSAPFPVVLYIIDEELMPGVSTTAQGRPAR